MNTIALRRITIILTMIKFFVEGKVETQAEECYTSHNTRRLGVDGVVKIILSTDNVQEELRGLDT